MDHKNPTIRLTPTPKGMKQIMDHKKKNFVDSNDTPFGLVNFVVVLKCDLYSTTFGDLSVEHSTPGRHEDISDSDINISLIAAGRANVMIKHAGMHICRCCSEMNISENLKVCKGCKQRLYCGKTCQKKDWRQHKTVCNVIRKEHEELVHAKCKCVARATRHNALPVCQQGDTHMDGSQIRFVADGRK
jgi:hypothetical protein